MGAWLSQRGVELEVRDFFKKRFTERELRDLLGDRPVCEFFSWASPSFRRLGLDRHALDADQLIAMMLEQPRMIRRPLTVVDGELLSAKSGVDAIIAAVEGKVRAVGAS